MCAWCCVWFIFPGVPVPECGRLVSVLLRIARPVCQSTASAVAGALRPFQSNSKLRRTCISQKVTLSTDISAHWPCVCWPPTWTLWLNSARSLDTLANHRCVSGTHPRPTSSSECVSVFVCSGSVLQSTTRILAAIIALVTHPPEKTEHSHTSIREIYCHSTAFRARVLTILPIRSEERCSSESACPVRVAYSVRSYTPRARVCLCCVYVCVCCAAVLIPRECPDILSRCCVAVEHRRHHHHQLAFAAGLDCFFFFLAPFFTLDGGSVCE